MPIQVDIRKTFLYKWGKEEGLKEGKQEGLREGLKKAILSGIKLKFGPSKARQVRKLLVKINDMNQLEKINKELIRAENWQEEINLKPMPMQVDIRKLSFTL
jgi:predicted transposase YdaD